MRREGLDFLNVSQIKSKLYNQRTMFSKVKKAFAKDVAISRNAIKRTTSGGENNDLKKGKLKKTIVNIVMLYGLSAAKLLFPLLTLPYLTRVLSLDGYGAVSYVKSVMQYMQLLVDFGFMLSGVKDVVNTRRDPNKLSQEVFDILLSRILLALGAFAATIVIIFAIPLLRQYKLYTFLSLVPVALSVLLFDYYFRGIEQMQVITIRYVVMRGISTLLTFVFVKSDSDILMIPILDIVGSFVAVLLISFNLKKYGLVFKKPNLRSAVTKIKTSAVYFVSNIATTVFGALNTLLIGIFLPTADVALWSVSIQLISAVQTLYIPITDGVYPEMVKHKNLHLIKRILYVFMPVVLLGSVLSAVIAEPLLLLVGGKEYLAAVPVFRYLVPVLVFSFPGILLGWPTLGSIEKQKQVTITTVFAAMFQVVGLAILAVAGFFTLVNIVNLRWITELFLMAMRAGFCVKYRKEFY